MAGHYGYSITWHNLIRCSWLMAAVPQKTGSFFSRHGQSGTCRMWCFALHGYYHVSWRVSQTSMLITRKLKLNAVEQFTSEDSSIEYGPGHDVETGSVSVGVSNETEHLGSRKGATFFCGYLSGLFVLSGDSASSPIHFIDSNCDTQCPN